MKKIILVLEVEYEELPIMAHHEGTPKRLEGIILNALEDKFVGMKYTGTIIHKIGKSKNLNKSKYLTKEGQIGMDIMINHINPKIKK